ncbi:unnamed protein product [Rhodiola kirilowii]
MSGCRGIERFPLSLISARTSARELKRIHGQVILRRLLADSQFLGQFIAAIALKNPSNIEYSKWVLKQCAQPTVFALNSMIRAHCKSSNPEKGFEFYKRIKSSDDLSPDNYTFTFLVRACAQLLERETGLAVHGCLWKHGFGRDLHVQSGLIYMYGELGLVDYCHQVSDEITEPEVVCQTALISACAKCGDVGFARQVFDTMKSRDLFAWNAMMAGYVHCGKSKEALNLFHLMQMEGVRVNEVSIVSVLTACSLIGALEQGRWAHMYIERNGLRLTLTLGTALIDMYAKCGNMSKAMKVFWGMREKNVYTWSSAMSGLAMNGSGEECLELFSLMIQDGTLPNEVTFIAVLRACSVIGLVDIGRTHFESMRKIYHLQPRLEHYGCMVDLFGRAGRLNEAVDFIYSMPVKPHAVAWSALLNACRIHKNTGLAELASQKMIELEAYNECGYVQLSNIYADSRDWDQASNVRQTMKVKGVRKLPGCSVIEVDGEAHEFFVGDDSHPKYSEIELMLSEISRRLKLVGYKESTNPVLFDIEEEEKENAIRKHSEKIAIAYGLLSLKEHLPIRIAMNLRTCWDCHEAAKLIAKAFNRVIILRDRNRFHHFEDGQCACNDYW